MKKTTLCFAICALSITAFSQSDDTFKPVKGNKVITMNLSGLSVLALNSPTDPLNAVQVLNFRYFISDKVDLRLDLGFTTQTTNLTSKNDTAGGVPLVETTNKDAKSALSLGLGAEKHIATEYNRIDPFFGGGIYLTTIGKNTVTATNKTTLANGNYTDSKTITVNPGGLAIAFQANMGFFWYFAANLAIGGEYGFGYATGSQGGDKVVTANSTSSTGGVVTVNPQTITTTTVKASLSGFKTQNNGSIIILIKF